MYHKTEQIKLFHSLPLYDKVVVTCSRSVFYSGYSGYLHQWQTTTI